MEQPILFIIRCVVDMIDINRLTELLRALRGADQQTNQHGVPCILRLHGHGMLTSYFHLIAVSRIPHTHCFMWQTDSL